MKTDSYQGANMTGKVLLRDPMQQNMAGPADRTAGPGVTHANMPNKVLPTGHPAPPANEIRAPAITSMATSKPPAGTLTAKRG